MYKKKGRKRADSESGRSSVPDGLEAAIDSVSYDLPELYEKPRVKKIINGFGFFMLGLLNVSLIMSDLGRLARHQTEPLMVILVNYGFLVFVDLTMLLPLFFEAGKVEVKGETLTIHTPFFKAVVSPENIVSLSNPAYLKFACLRTKRCFYLLNRRDLKPFEKLEARIKQCLALSTAKPVK